MADGIEAVVLRTTRYGEADLIAQVYTRHGGRRGVIAKGARKPKSRLGARLEPFLSIRLQLHSGRGDLAIVRGVEVEAQHDGLRRSWRAQQLGASALDLVSRLTVEHESNEQLYHLLRHLLDLLDSTAGRGAEHEADDQRRGAALIAAFELKLLHVIGMAPELSVCVRCGSGQAIVAWFAADGGVVCSGCRTAGDAGMDAQLHEGAMRLMRDPLASNVVAAADELPSPRVLRTISSAIVAGMCEAHAGIRPRR